MTQVHHLEKDDSMSTISTQDREPQNSLEKAQELADYPDGGLRAWLVVLGSWIVQFCATGYNNAYGVYHDFYVREYLHPKYSSSQISTQLMLGLSIGLISGRGFDAGYFYHLTIGGSALLVFSLLMVSLTQPGQYYPGLGVGIAIGVMYVPSIGIISHYFQRRRAVAIGIAASGSALGGTVHPMMLNNLFHGPVGFRWGVRMSAGLLAGLLAVAVLLLKPRAPPTSRNQGSIIGSLRMFLRDLPYVLVVIGSVFVVAGLYFPVFFLQLYGISKGLNSGLAFYTIVVSNGVSVLGRVLPNMLVAHVGVFNMTITCVGICSLLVFCMSAVEDAPGIIVFAVLNGFFSGAYAALLPQMVGSLAEKDSEIGARMGVCFTFTRFGGLVGIPIAGALLSTSFVWWRPTLFSGLCMLCGASCFSAARFMISKKKGTKWL